MPRKFFKRFVPSHDKVRSDEGLRILRPILNKPYLWHLNRHSVARGLGWGCFWAMIPLPLQSPFAVFCAIRARGNVPLAFAATWVVSNPLTLVPHWWLAYTIGRFVLQTHPVDIEFTWSFLKNHATQWEWLMNNFWRFFLPLLVGSVFVGAMVGPVAYVLVNSIWTSATRARWRASRRRASERASAPPSPLLTKDHP